MKVADRCGRPPSCADIEGVLRAAIAGAFAFELAVAFLLALGLLQSGDLRLREHQAVLRHLGLQRLQPLLGVGEIVPQPHPRTPKGEIDRPCFFSLFETEAGSGRLLDRKLNHRRLNLGRHPVLQQRLAPLISCSASSPPFSYSSLKR